MKTNKGREYPRFKQYDDSVNYYGSFGDDGRKCVSVIHAKFGDFRKVYYFRPELQKEYPNFCAEYDKYFSYQKSVFQDPIQIVNYIERYAIPVRLYSNYCDKEFADFDAVREWICVERHCRYDFGEGKQELYSQSMDGSPKA